MYRGLELADVFAVIAYYLGTGLKSMSTCASVTNKRKPCAARSRHCSPGPTKEELVARPGRKA